MLANVTGETAPPLIHEPAAELALGTVFPFEHLNLKMKQAVPALLRRATYRNLSVTLLRTAVMQVMPTMQRNDPGVPITREFPMLGKLAVGH
jgi:hypothetical protein